MNPHLSIAHRLINRPLAMDESRARLAIAEVAEAGGGVRQLLASMGVRADAEKAAASESGLTPTPTMERPYQITGDGVAILEIDGVILHRWGWGPCWGVTGLDWLRMAFMVALVDADVRAIALTIDSPGGEVAGTFDLADTIFAARGTKPVWAILNEEAYSAAYALASAADRITVPRTGGAGSIGVIAIGVEFSRLLDKEGITVNLIRHGDYKAEGNPYEALSDGARARIQADVDAVGALFIDTVARNRGLKPSVIQATKAACLFGPESVRLGLADAVASPDEAYRALVATL